MCAMFQEPVVHPITKSRSTCVSVDEGKQPSVVLVCVLWSSQFSRSVGIGHQANSLGCYPHLLCRATLQRAQAW